MIEEWKEKLRADTRAIGLVPKFCDQSERVPTISDPKTDCLDAAKNTLASLD